MDFAIHAGPVAASGLVAALEAARDHWVATHSVSDADASLDNLNKAIASAGTPELRDTLTAARNAHVAKMGQSPEIAAAVALMNAGIGKASPASATGLVTVTISGFAQTGREDHVAKRLSVDVDEFEAASA